MVEGWLNWKENENKILYEFWNVVIKISVIFYWICYVIELVWGLYWGNVVIFVFFYKFMDWGGIIYMLLI